jgi:hypothetical protein
MDGDLVTVVVVDYVDVPGYTSYMPGDVASFERSVAETLIQQRRVRRFQEVPPTTPAPSTSAVPGAGAETAGAGGGRTNDARAFGYTCTSERNLVSPAAAKDHDQRVSGALPVRATTVEPRVLGQDSTGGDRLVTPARSGRNVSPQGASHA